MVTRKSVGNKTIDLTIVGSGYWGSATANVARSKGISCCIIDDGDKQSGSRNASAVCDPGAYSSDIFSKYWPQNLDRSKLGESIDWLKTVGGYEVLEYFWNMYQDRPIRPRSKVIYLPEPETLTDQVNDIRRVGRVSNIEEHQNYVETFYTNIDNGEEFVVKSKSVLLATGYRTDSVLTEVCRMSPIGVGKLLGRGITCKGKPTTELPVSVMIKPYVKHTVRVWTKGRLKVGDTAEKVESPNKLKNLRTVMDTVVASPKSVKIQTGYRPVLDRFLVDKVSSRIVVATGGHRLGLGLSKLVADKVLEIIL